MLVVVKPGFHKMVQIVPITPVSKLVLAIRAVIRKRSKKVRDNDRDRPDHQFFKAI